MNKISIILTLMLISSVAFGQTTKIEPAKLHITMPNQEWGLADTQTNGEMQIYFFKRTAIVDSQLRNVIPNISIITEPNNGLDVVTYSAMKRSSMPFEITEIFIPKDIKMKYKNGIGYKGTYNDDYGKHQIYAIFLVNGETGVRIICDVLDEQFEEVEPEFLSAIKSISDKKKK